MVKVLPLAGDEGAAMGLSVSPTVTDRGTVLAVGPGLSAGRLKRYLEAQVGATSADREE